MSGKQRQQPLCRARLDEEQLINKVIKSSAIHSLSYKSLMTIIKLWWKSTRSTHDL